VSEAAQLRGPAGVLAVLLLELGVGSMAVLVAAPIWGVVKRGYFLIVASTVATCGLLAWLAARGPLGRAHGSTAGLAGHLVFEVFLWSVCTVVAVEKGAWRIARVLGLATVLWGTGAVGALAVLRGGSTWAGVAPMVTGAVFVGATWDGMLLGHWYLVDRKLKVDPMKWHTWAYTVGVALALVSAGLARGGRPTGSEASLNPLLLVSDLTLYLAFGLVGVCALLAFFVHKLVNEGSIRAATGMLYLAVIMAMAAEFAAKARFFTV
jgi:hypothetical protein